MTRGTTRIAQLTAAPLNQRMPLQHRCRTDHEARFRPDLPTHRGLRPGSSGRISTRGHDHPAYTVPDSLWLTNHRTYFHHSINFQIRVSPQLISGSRDMMSKFKDRDGNSSIANRTSTVCKLRARVHSTHLACEPPVTSHFMPTDVDRLCSGNTTDVLRSITPDH